MTDQNQATHILVDKFKFLRGLGFDDPKSSIEESNLMGASILVTYSSISFQRDIKLGYVAENGSHPATISVLICGDRGESFSLEDWVQKKYPSHQIAFVANQGVQSEQAFLEKFCSECRTIFEGPLRNTVTGKEWDAVPFDWKGYR